MPQRIVAYIPRWSNSLAVNLVRVASVGSTVRAGPMFSAAEAREWFIGSFPPTGIGIELSSSGPFFFTPNAVESETQNDTSRGTISAIFYRRSDRAKVAALPAPHFGFYPATPGGLSSGWVDGAGNALSWPVDLSGTGWVEFTDIHAVLIEADASLPALGVAARLRDPADAMSVTAPLAFGVSAKVDADTALGVPDGANLPSLEVVAELSMGGEIAAAAPLEFGVEATLRQDAYEIAASLPLAFGVAADVTVELVPRPGAWHRQAVTVVGPDWTRRLWTGPIPVTIAGKRFEAAGGPDGTLIGIEPGESALGPPGRRARGYIFVAPESFRRVISQDLGPAAATINWVVSKDKGQTWELLAELFTGRLSDGSIDLQTGIWSFDLETWHGDADRVATRRWSYDEQYRRSGDLGFEYLSQLASGIDIDWRI